MNDVPKDRFNVDAFYHPDASRLNTVGLTYLVHGQVLIDNSTLTRKRR